FQPARIMDLQVVHIEDHVAVIRHHAVAVHRVAAELDDFPGDVAAGHGDDLHRQRELAEGGDQLAFIRNADEGAGDGGDDLLPGQGSAAALDQFQVPVGLVGTVHVVVQVGDIVQVIDRNPVLLEALGGGFGAGHGAIEKTLVAGQGVDETVGGRAGPDPDDAPVFQIGQQNLYRGLPNGLLEFVLGHCPLPLCFWIKGQLYGPTRTACSRIGPD